MKVERKHLKNLFGRNSFKRSTGEELSMKPQWNATTTQWGRTVFPTNGAKQTGYSPAKE